MPSDAQRIQQVKLLADNGYADRVVVAQDMHLKHRLVRSQCHIIWLSLENGSKIDVFFTQTCDKHVYYVPAIAI